MAMYTVPLLVCSDDSVVRVSFLGVALISCFLGILFFCLQDNTIF